jgi:mono/diheme cytochrome c family protein
MGPERAIRTSGTRPARTLWVIAVAVAAFAALAPQIAIAQDAAQLKRGQAVVTRSCGACHAVGRSDASRHREAPALRTLGQRYPIESLEEALAEGIVSGHPDMPELKFEPSDVGAIVAYLKSIQDK